jgi:glycerol-3-phosphate O-acyltransferase
MLTLALILIKASRVHMSFTRAADVMMYPLLSTMLYVTWRAATNHLHLQRY